jgi:hypothetical protein
MLKLRKAAAVVGITTATLGAGGMIASSASASASASASTATPATVHSSATPKKSSYICSYYGWGWGDYWGYNSYGIYGYWYGYYYGWHYYYC